MPREQHPSEQQRASLQAELLGITGGGTVVTHKHNQPNEPGAFPNLNLSELERYAEKWANKLHLAKVSRIIMYRPKLNALGIRTRAENEKDRRPPIQYIVVFECQYDLKKISPETASLLESADRTPPLYPAFLDDNFICVYKQPPAHEFSLDWHLEDAAPGDPPCELADLEFKWAWVLYPRHKPDAVKEPAKPEERSAGEFRCPSGTGWNDITITFVEMEWVKIRTPFVEKRAHYSELGWADARQSGKFKRQWGLLLDFAANQTVGKRSIEYNNLSKLISDLSRDLKNIFGIQENPFALYNKKQGVYSPRFQSILGIDRKALENQFKNAPGSIFDSEVEEKSAVVGNQATRTERPNME